MSMKTLLALIDQRLKAEGLSERKACLKAGIGPDGIRTIRNGFKPKTDKLKKLAPVLGVALDDLMQALDPTTITKARPLPATGLESITEIDVRAGAGQGGEAMLENLTSPNGITVSADAARGEWLLPVEYLSEIRVRARSIRIVEVFGDSMRTQDGGGLHSGDRVMVDLSDTNPSPPGIFALWDGFGVVIKRLERIPRSDPPAIRLISDNPRHAPYELTGEEVHIIGRVVWFARRL